MEQQISNLSHETLLGIYWSGGPRLHTRTTELRKMRDLRNPEHCASRCSEIGEDVLGASSVEGLIDSRNHGEPSHLPPSSASTNQPLCAKNQASHPGLGNRPDRSVRVRDRAVFPPSQAAGTCSDHRCEYQAGTTDFSRRLTRGITEVNLGSFGVVFRSSSFDCGCFLVESSGFGRFGWGILDVDLRLEGFFVLEVGRECAMDLNLRSRGMSGLEGRFLWIFFLKVSR